MFFNIAKAEIKNILTKPQEANQFSFDNLASISSFFNWSAVFILIVGFLILAGAFFLYLLAAGVEEKMSKAHSTLIGAFFFILGAIVVYLLGKIF